ncbi:MAG: sulfite exporter TauE/SafE family protein [Acidobacteriota bacterium]|nr:sulfite exporter TauE/SafE family protein [Acidobacteriota bacterium]
MNISHWATVEVPTVLFLATVIRSAFGFGEALIAVPLLALLVPVEVAAPVAVLVSITVAAIAVVQDWHLIHLRSAGGLVITTLFGIPLGLLLLKMVAEPVVKAVLGIVIVAFSTYSLLSRANYELKNDKFAGLFGFVAGILGGAYGMNGPPLVIYGSLRKWSPQHFRATLQGYFLPASVIGMVGYWIAGLWTPEVTRFYLLSLPLILVATFLGRVINQRMNARGFLFYTHAGLIVIGTILLLQSVTRRTGVPPHSDIGFVHGFSPSVEEGEGREVAVALQNPVGIAKF